MDPIKKSVYIVTEPLKNQGSDENLIWTENLAHWALDSKNVEIFEMITKQVFFIEL